MQSRHPYQVMAAITVALALGFAAVESASLDPSAAAERADAKNLIANFGKTAFESLPSQ